MRLATGRWIRVLVLAALVMALLVPASAGAESRRAARDTGDGGSMRALVANDPDDNGDKSTADPLTASPVTGQLTYNTDYDDVYSVDLQAGEVFTAYVTHAAGVDVDLFLFANNGVSVESDDALAVTDSASSPDMLYDLDSEQFVAPATDTYYLDAFMIGAPSATTAYPYTISYARGDERPDVSLKSSASTVSYGGTPTLSGVVKDSTDTSMTGESVELWARSYPSDTYTRRATGTTDGNGSFTFKPSVTRWTIFKVVCTTNAPDYAWGESDTVSVKSRVSLGAPKVYSGKKYHGRAFTVYGYLKPRHTTGQKHVKITATRLDSGVWKGATNYYKDATYTKYSTKIILPYKGKWKLVASTPDDGYHAATTSSATYVTVR